MEAEERVDSDTVRPVPAHKPLALRLVLALTARRLLELLTKPAPDGCQNMHASPVAARLPPLLCFASSL